MNDAFNYRRISLFLGWMVVAVGGFCLQVAVQPPPAHGITGLAPIGPVFFCALAWLAILLYLGGLLLFGWHSRLWHGAVFCFVGGGVGFFDGFYFAFLFGAAVGMFCGAVLGGLVFVLRYAIIRAA